MNDITLDDLASQARKHGRVKTATVSQSYDHVRVTLKDGGLVLLTVSEIDGEPGSQRVECVQCHSDGRHNPHTSLRGADWPSLKLMLVACLGMPKHDIVNTLRYLATLSYCGFDGTHGTRGLGAYLKGEATTDCLNETDRLLLDLTTSSPDFNVHKALAYRFMV